VVPVADDERERKQSLLDTGLLQRFVGQIGKCNGAKDAGAEQEEEVAVREEKGARRRPWLLLVADRKQEGREGRRHNALQTDEDLGDSMQRVLIY
jgi:hypothetical protein